MAAQDMQRLVVALEARTKSFENALNKANGVANRRATAIESRFAKMNKTIGTRMVGIGKGWVAGLAAALGGRELMQLSDSATKIDNALRIAGLSGEELEKVYGRLRDSAVKNAAPLEALVELYGRAALVQKELGVTSEELVNFSDQVALALRVSGKTAQESSGALLQLSQALGAGTVRAEEFNSILEGAPTIAQAAAAGLKEAGGSVARLRQLVVDGKISSEAFFRAFEAGAPILEQKVSGATYTIDQSLGNLRTALVDSAWEFNQATDAGGRFAEGVNNVAKTISDFDVGAFIKKIQEVGGALETFMNDAGNAGFFEWLAEKLTGLELEVGKPINLDTALAEQQIAHLERDMKLLEETIEENKKLELDTSDAQMQLDLLLRKASALRGTVAPRGYQVGTPGDPNALAQKTGGLAPPVAVKPVSTNDFDPPSGSKKSVGSKRQNEWQRETAQIKERTAALQAETAAMAGLNPLINDYGFAIEKARAAAELENAALAAKVEITPEVKASIESLASSYANATVQAEMLAERQDRVRESAEEMADLGKDVFGGFISDLREGKDAADILAGALDKIADKLANIALDTPFNGITFSFGALA